MTFTIEIDFCCDDADLRVFITTFASTIDACTGLFTLSLSLLVAAALR